MGDNLRIDRQENLKKIASLFKTQSELYPNFREKNIRVLIEKAIELHDPRTMKLYFDCVTSHSIPDKIKGFYDLTQFCNIVGV